MILSPKEYLYVVIFLLLLPAIVAVVPWEFIYKFFTNVQKKVRNVQK